MDNPSKPGPKSISVATRTAILAEIARLDLRGVPQGDMIERIADRFNVRFSQQSIGYHLKKIQAAYLDRVVADREQRVARIKAQYELVLREAWEAYDKSMLDQEHVEEHMGVKYGGKGGNGTEVRVDYPPADDNDSGLDVGGDIFDSSMKRLKSIKKRTGRVPANEFLKTITDVLKAFREIDGVDAPTKVDTNVRTIDWDATAGKPADTDPFDEAVRKEEAGEVEPEPSDDPLANPTTPEGDDDDGDPLQEPSAGGDK